MNALGNPLIEQFPQLGIVLEIEMSSSKDEIDNFTFVSSSESVYEETKLRKRFKDENKEEEIVEDEEDHKLIEAKAKLSSSLSEASTDNSFPICHANLFIILVAIFFRLLVALHSYSGMGVPPVFGDFEAQRHWMEITINVPLKDWYRNTGTNDLKYWGLDYPPLSAYWAYLTGYL